MIPKEELITFWKNIKQNVEIGNYITFDIDIKGNRETFKAKDMQEFIQLVREKENNFTV